MADSRSTAPALGVFALIARSIRLLGAQFGFLFPLAFVPALALSALTYAFADPAPLDPAAAPRLSVAEGVVLFVDVMASFVITGVMCLAALDAVLGKRHTVSEYLRQTLRHIAPIVGLGLLVSIATGIGALLLILPGFYVVARYLPWTPAVVFENAGWSGLGRGQSLTEGYRWPLVGAVLLMGVIVTIILLAAGPAIVAVGEGLAGVLVEGAFTAFYYALIAVFTALVYIRLREIKDGMSAADIAATID
jgi:hypothetical protein